RSSTGSKLGDDKPERRVYRGAFGRAAGTCPPRSQGGESPRGGADQGFSSIALSESQRMSGARLHGDQLPRLRLRRKQPLPYVLGHGFEPIIADPLAVDARHVAP